MARTRIPSDPTEDIPSRLTRRSALTRGAGIIGGLSIGAQVMAATGADTAFAASVRKAAGQVAKPGYGKLVQHTGEMSLPAGFHATAFGHAGSKMSDGLPTPQFHDGTTCVGLGGGQLLLVRNHEGYDTGRAIGKRRAYDRVAQGGVTASVFDTRTGKLRESALVLNGTDNNCNGGPTPWGSWLSCEESTVGPIEGFEKKHGYVFEVPFSARGLIDPVPIKAMGRFEHEACVIDPATGIVYMTEDNGDPADGFYRYLPDHPGQLHRGGTLQMLAVHGRSRYITYKNQTVGERLRCEWVDIDDPDPSDAENHPDAVFEQGVAKGAAQFMGLEGAHWSRGSVYFVASEAGDRDEGQIWRYTPVGLKHGELVLLYESEDKTVLDQPDSLAVSPRGGVVVCEDGDGEDVNGGTNYIRCLTPAGQIETFARNDTPLDLHRWEDTPKGWIGRSEYSGATYSPDGRWLFVNIQYPGTTFAITGPWEKGWL